MSLFNRNKADKEKELKKFVCEYKLDAPMSGNKGSIKVKRLEDEAPVLTYFLEEKGADYKVEGSLEVPEEVIGKIRHLVDTHLVAIRSGMVPVKVNDTSAESFTVTIDGRYHSFTKEHITAQTNDDAVEKSWDILSAYIPEEERAGSQFFFS